MTVSSILGMKCDEKGFEKIKKTGTIQGLISNSKLKKKIVMHIIPCSYPSPSPESKNPTKHLNLPTYINVSREEIILKEKKWRQPHGNQKAPLRNYQSVIFETP